MVGLYALTGDTDSALARLSALIDLPGNDFFPLSPGLVFSSPLFAPLTEEAEFQRLVAEYERRKTASANEARAMIQAAGL